VISEQSQEDPSSAEEASFFDEGLSSQALELERMVDWV